MNSVFLSYAGTDEKIAEQVNQGLTAAGLNIWKATDRINVGDIWFDKLEDSMSNCSAYTILVGSAGIKHWAALELKVALNRNAESNGAFPICPLLLPGVQPEDLPPFLAMFQAEKLAHEPTAEDFEHIAQQITKSIGKSSSNGLNPVPPTQDCPFPGLESYNEDSAKYFFGRQVETLDALSLLGSTHDGTYRPWLQVEGPSGVGKSSLVKAGMIPAVRRGWIEERFEQSPYDWKIGFMRPGSDPVFNLAEALIRALEIRSPDTSLSDLKALLRGSDSEALRDYIRQKISSRGRFLLVVDQFEELFTLWKDAVSRERFDALIASALEDREGVFYLITTIRSDFTLHLGRLTRLSSLLNRRAERYYLKPIDENGLREVLRNSLRQAGLEWDEPTLPERIVNSAIGESNALPLVNKLLWLLWQRRTGGVLHAGVYEELGGVGGALARSADELLDGLGKEGKKLARQLLLRLVKVSFDSQPTRRTISLNTAIRAAGGGEKAELLLNRLSGANDQESTQDVGHARLILIFTSEQTAKPYVDLAHEALLTKWDTLRNWISSYRDQLFAEEGLEEAAQHWSQSGKPRIPGVPSRSLMRRYQRASAPSELAEDYLRAVKFNRRLRLSLMSLVLSVLFGISSFGAWINNEGLSVRAGAYLLFASVGIYYFEPEMVKVPAGRFLMGSLGQDLSSSKTDVDPCGYMRNISLAHESPQHEVFIEQSFLIGKYEVTFDEYDIFAHLSESVEIPTDDGWGRGQRPVIYVSWEDATAYAAWLSDKTGKTYRLPSEAEWEYVARAGSPTNNWWGEDMVPNMANCWRCGSNWEGKNENKKTSPVGEFPANPFGLHDTAGNVWEWVQDCWHAGYEQAPTDGSAWEQANQGNCSWRVLRGGAWNSSHCEKFSVTRHRSSQNAKDNSMGFRLILDL